MIKHSEYSITENEINFAGGIKNYYVVAFKAFENAENSYKSL